MRIKSLVLAFLLIPSLCWGGMIIQKFSSAAGGGCAGYLACWEAENTYTDGVSGTWTNSAEGSFNSSAPLDGSYSAQITQSQDAGAEYFQSPDITYTSGNTVYGFFMVEQVTANDNYSGANWVAGYDSTDTKIFSIQNRHSAIRLYHGTAQNEIYPTVAVGTPYYVWWDYTPGTGANGTANFYWSTDGTKPGSPNLSVSNGTSTTDVQYIQHQTLYNTSSGYKLYDKSLISTTTIGSQ